MCHQAAILQIVGFQYFGRTHTQDSIVPIIGMQYTVLNIIVCLFGALLCELAHHLRLFDMI
jgi:hypothetical protein